MGGTSSGAEGPLPGVGLGRDSARDLPPPAGPRALSGQAQVVVTQPFLAAFSAFPPFHPRSLVPHLPQYQFRVRSAMPLKVGYLWDGHEAEEVAVSSGARGSQPNASRPS